MDESQRFDVFTRQIFDREITGDGISFNYYLTDPAALGLDQYSPDLGGHNRAYTLQKMVQYREDLAQLLTFDYTRLTPEQQLTYDILRGQIELDLTAEGLDLFTSYTTLNDGILTTYPKLLADYRLRDEKTIEDYLALLADLPRVFEEALSLEQERSQAGMFMPACILDKVLKAGNNLLEVPEGFMLESFEERLGEIENISIEEKNSYMEQNRQVWLEQVVPAGYKLLEGLEALRDTCSEALGLCQYPQGKEYYTYLTKSRTGLDSSVEEIISMLEKAIQENLEQMRGIYLSNQQAYMEALRFGTSTSNIYNSPEAIMEFLKQATADEFPSFGPVTYEIKEVPKSLQDSTAPAYYLTPPIDKPEENFIYINPLYKGQTQGESLVETLAHEGYPGHLLQRNYFNQQNPSLLRHIIGCLGYTEGWANYVDSQVYRWLGYSQEACNFLLCENFLSSALMARLDIGIHYQGWQAEDVRNYLQQMGYSSDYAQEIFENSLADPGNSLPYVFGQMEFTRLRTLAEEQLQDKFNVVEFHRAVLDCGPVPFSILSKQVEKYIDNTLSKVEVSDSQVAAAAIHMLGKIIQGRAA